MCLVVPWLAALKSQRGRLNMEFFLGGVSVLLGAFGYRLAGLGIPFGKVFWGLSVFLVSYLATQNYSLSSITAIAAFISRQYLSHGAVYQMLPGKRHEGPWWAVCFVRMHSLLVASNLTPLGTILLAGLIGFVGIFINKASGYLESTRRIPDMLRVAEPLQGAVYAGVLYLVLRVC